MAKRSTRTIARDWNLTRVGAKLAQGMLPTDDNGEINWGGVDVAQIDTGYTEHPVFGFPGNTHIRPRFGRNYQQNESSDPKDPLDYDGLMQFPGHGTHVASIICGQANGKFGGGIAPGLPLIPYRVTDTVVIGFPAGSKRERVNVAAAIRHAIDVNDVDVINISLGAASLSPFGSRPLGEAVDYAYEKGVIICAAAGQVSDSVTYPGKFFRTIGCGGMEHDNTMWNSADQGYHEFDLEHIDVWAPGNDINRPVAKLDGSGQLQTNVYARDGSGTSYATAHVTAAAAMWIVKHGTAIDQVYGHAPWMRIEAFRKLIKSTSKALQGDQEPYPGTGIIDIRKLLEAPLPEPASLKKEDRLAANMWG